MSGGEWLAVENEERQTFYRTCRDLHNRAITLSVKLQEIFLQLQIHSRSKTEGKIADSLKNDAVDPEQLKAASEAMQIVVDSLKSLTQLEVPSDKKSLASGIDSSSLSSYQMAGNSTPTARTLSVCRFKMKYWKEVLWQDSITVAYLTSQAVSEILAQCHNVAQQNHNHMTLESVFRLSSLYNELLTLSEQNNKGIATSCRNTCPVLLHPLRKLSITKILQTLAQFRAEKCCCSLVDGLLETYRSMARGQTPCYTDIEGNEFTTPENSDNSSLDVYRALTRHMTPPGANAVLPPVEKVGEIVKLGKEDIKTLQTHLVYSSGLEHLLIEEETHLAVLLSVAARSAPHLLGHGGIKPSRTSGTPHVSKQVRTKVVEYYQQVLWGEVGAYSEHILLWWSTGPLIGTLPTESCQLLCDWLRSLVTAGVVAELVLPAVQSIVDGLSCHVTTTSWDQHFRRTLVQRYKFSCSNQKDKGSISGQLFAELLRELVNLNNACEPLKSSEQPINQSLEELPLVEQIPILHRLDHSVHTTRMWATNTARSLINSWTVDAFFLVTQTDINLCLGELQQLQLTDHQNLSEIRSEHVMVCAKMRAKLVSEVRENICKLKLLPEECIQGMAKVCRTVSLANLHMCFPEPHYWRKSSSATPKVASSYVRDYLERVLRPVLVAVAPLPVPVQQTVGSMVLRILCEAWLDHIYMHRIKFSEWGALQLLVDFGSVPDWLGECGWLVPEVQNKLIRHEVLRRCEGVGRLLLRRRGDQVAMVASSGGNKDNNGRSSRRASVHSAGLESMPAEMFVPNQEQWLELRAPKHKGLCGVLCCGS